MLKTKSKQEWFKQIWPKVYDRKQARKVNKKIFDPV